MTTSLATGPVQQCGGSRPRLDRHNKNDPPVIGGSFDVMGEPARNAARLTQRGGGAGRLEISAGSMLGADGTSTAGGGTWAEEMSRLA